jgi:hypothetical protein
MPFADFPQTLPEFDRRFGDEVACWNYLRDVKWPDGFRCADAQCAGRRSYFIIERGVDECATCGKQTSVTAGTMFHRLRSPLHLWFRAIFEFVAAKSGCNACHLSRVLGLSYPTAWKWLHKIRDVFRRPERTPLEGPVEADETSGGGPAPGCFGRSCGENQWLVAGAVEVRDRGRGPGCGRVRLASIDDARMATLQPFLETAIAKGARVYTDAFNGYLGLDAEYDHRVRTIRDPKKAAQKFPCIHRVFALFKRVMLGTYQGSWSRKWAALYCEEFVFRFNRRDAAHRTHLFRRVVEQAVLRAPRIHALAGKRGPERVLPVAG